MERLVIWDAIVPIMTSWQWYRSTYSKQAMCTRVLEVDKPLISLFLTGSFFFHCWNISCCHGLPTAEVFGPPRQNQYWLNTIYSLFEKLMRYDKTLTILSSDTMPSYRGFLWGIPCLYVCGKNGGNCSFWCSGSCCRQGIFSHDLHKVLSTIFTDWIERVKLVCVLV